MIVRSAVEADRLAVIGLLKQAHIEAEMRFPFSAPHVDALFRSHLADGLVLVLGEVPAGVLMARCFEHPLGAGRWAAETVWFIGKNSRGRSAVLMLDAYEAWARSMGCVSVGMASLVTNDVGPIYHRRGYVAAEMHFLKAL